MQIPGGTNKTDAKAMPVSARAAQIVHGERGSRPIPGSKNAPHTIVFAGDQSVGPTAPRTALPRVPGGHNAELGSY